METNIKVSNEGTMKILAWPSKTYINVMELRPEDIHIRDVAHALSNICRYNGHVSHFYSVAQHSVLIAQRFPKASDNRIRGLLHDGPEAYLGDLIAPLKYSGHFQSYMEAEDYLDGVFCERFGLEAPLVTKPVKEADMRIRGSEMRDLKEYDPPEIDSYAFTIKPWLPEFAKHMFLVEAEELGLLD